MKKLGAAILGALVILIVIEGMLRIGGGIHSYSTRRRNLSALDGKNSVIVLCLGDSMTYNQYPRPLEKILNKQTKELGWSFTTIDEGQPGTGSGYVSENLIRFLNKYEPDILLVMTGANDRAGEVIYGGLPLGGGSFLRVLDLIRLLSYNISELLLDRSDISKNSGISTDKTPSSVIRCCGNKTEDYGALIAELSRKRQNKSSKEYIKYLEEKIIDHPKLCELYDAAAEFYRSVARYDDLERVAKKWLSVDSDSSGAYFNLGWVNLMHYGNEEKAEKFFSRAAELNPYDSFSLSSLASTVMRRGDSDVALDLLHRALEIDPHDTQALNLAGHIYEVRRDYDMANKYYTRAYKVNKYLRNIKELSSNLNYVRDEAVRRGIPVVFIQYPMRKLADLESLLKPHPQVYYVDNYKLFKNLVNEKGYGAVFEDRFGGDFGHMTRMGNIVLSENIADTIFNEVYRLNISE